MGVGLLHDRDRSAYHDVSTVICSQVVKIVKEDDAKQHFRRHITAQMAEWYRASLLSCRLGFDSESGQTNDFNIGIHSFPA